MSFQPIKDRKRRLQLGFPGPVGGTATESTLALPDLFPGFEQLNTAKSGPVKPPPSGKSSDSGKSVQTLESLSTNEGPAGGAIGNPAMVRQTVFPGQHRKDDSLGDPERRQDKGTQGETTPPSGNPSMGFALGRNQIITALLVLGGGFLALQWIRGG